jgi:hypothetical protein
MDHHLLPSRKALGPMMHVDQLASVLVAENPRQAADKLLAWLVSYCHAAGGAILSIQARNDGPQPDLILLMSRNLSVERVPDIRFLWTSHRGLLLSGRSVTDRHHALAPVTDGSEVIALLYLERAKTFQLEKLTAFRIALAKAVRAALAGTGSTETVQGSFLSMRPEDIIREQLLMALHQEEWCIARAARTLGVTRRTIYLRMQRLGIPRKPRAGESSP